MKKRRSLLVVLASVAVLPGCAQLAELVGKPTVKGVRPRITGLDFEGVKLAFDLDVNNPYPVPIKSPRVRYGLDIAGTELVRSEAPVEVDLPAKKVGTFTIPVALKYKNVYDLLTKAKDAREVDYTLSGAVLLSALGQSYELPLSHKGKFPVLRPPTFSDVKFRLSDVSFTKAGITIDANVANPNVFALGIQDLGYTFKVGDVELAGLTAASAGAISPDQKGRVSLTGQVSAIQAVAKLLKGSGLGTPSLTPKGFIQTPYGKVELQR